MSIANSNPSGEPARADAPTLPRSILPGRLWLYALAAGLTAGLVAALGGEAVFERFKPVIVYPPNWDKISPFDKPDIISNLLRKQTPVVEFKNAAAAYGLLGAVLGGALGLAAGLAKRSTRSAMTASLVGVLGGAATGVGLSAVLIPVFFRIADPESGMMPGLLIHAGIWAPIGAVAGLAFGIGLGGSRSIVLALLGGLAGAALGTMVYEVASSLAFPNVRLDKPIPSESSSRILGDFCVTAFAALGAALGVGERSGKPTPKDRHPLS